MSTTCQAFFHVIETLRRVLETDSGKVEGSGAIGRSLGSFLERIVDRPRGSRRAGVIPVLAILLLASAGMWIIAPFLFQLLAGGGE